jgi:metal-responsive CopG/Arc/MetJ family transcriptional regulator
MLYPMKRTNVFLDEKNLKRLERIGKTKGGLKVAQVIRIAIQEYIDREEGKA